MLAEERKGEMGVARALGMRRKNLVQSFVSEGLLYALLSSVVGTFAGLLVAAIISWGFAQIFPTGVGGNAFAVIWTWSDLLTGFSIGFLITMATIGIASFRVSKLNIVRAIRDIPEPISHRSTRRQVIVGSALAGLGTVGTLASLATQNLILQDAGPSALAIGFAVLTMRLTSPRIVFTSAGVLMLAWLLSPWKFFSTATADITLFIIVGLLLILGGLLIVLFNSDTILAVATRLVRGRTWRPVVRTAIAYPMNKKFRTGATLASIALVMFTIATMSGIQAMVSSSISMTSYRESGGFDLFANSLVPIPNWDSAIGGYQAATQPTNVTANHGIPQARVRIAANASFSGVQHNSTLIGSPPDWAPSFPLQARDSVYRDDAAASTAIQSDPGLAIIDAIVVPNDFGPNFGSFSAVLNDIFHSRDMTGAPRAVGFRKSVVLRAFLFELSFIALTGITMGVALGIALSYDLFLRFFEGQAAFVIPWDRLVLLGGIAFLGSVLATASPAIRASKMPPAEALRSFE